MSNNSFCWFDAGVNLFSQQFDQDRDQVVARAKEAGVQQQLLISSDLAETTLNIQYCQQQTGMLTTAGVHPHQAAAVAEGWLPQLQLLLQQPEVVAVGECGLDFNRMFSAKDQQISVFSAQLSLAKQLQKAVYLHEREAFSDQLALLKQHQIDFGIAHCFTGDATQLKAYLDLGLYIGITGWLCDERRATMLQDALQYLPLDRLILETDAPYLLPRNLTVKPKSRRNEPAFISAIAQQIAQLRGWSLADIAHHSHQNAQSLFSRPSW
ncbi:hydrolase TatD [Rheinheimera riviphila]|uniref:Hydrolase TatD n=1 Tax=Rheinheimera riviphila TaxID=1834037 RepID=A0A437QZL6_9GAMM|nr:TatD family hydrolase [Rheinheimera riviphila]RVU39930.1 hydrolase TatD [Rheinheimera riviphila]